MFAVTLTRKERVKTRIVLSILYDLEIRQLTRDDGSVVQSQDWQQHDIVCGVDKETGALHDPMILILQY